MKQRLQKRGKAHSQQVMRKVIIPYRSRLQMRLPNIESLSGKDTSKQAGARIRKAQSRSDRFELV